MYVLGVCRFAQCFPWRQPYRLNPVVKNWNAPRHPCSFTQGVQKTIYVRYIFVWPKLQKTCLLYILPKITKTWLNKISTSYEKQQQSKYIYIYVCINNIYIYIQTYKGEVFIIRIALNALLCITIDMCIIAGTNTYIYIYIERERESYTFNDFKCVSVASYYIYNGF